MTDRQLELIHRIHDYIESEEDDLYLDFDDYRELDEWLQKSLKLKDLVKELQDVADALCDRIMDFPAGCDACSLCDEDYDEDYDCDFCKFEKVKKRYKELIG